MKKLNNKGFSLVELIIVIAIMAILIGVVGTQVIPYLENSRKAKDKQVLSSLNTAGMSTYTSCAGQLNGNYSYRIQIANDGTGTGNGVSIWYRDDSGLASSWSETSGWVAAATAEQGSGMHDVYFSLTGLDKSGTQITKQMTSKDGKKITEVNVYIPCASPIYTKTTTDPAGLFEDIENK